MTDPIWENKIKILERILANLLLLKNDYNILASKTESYFQIIKYICHISTSMKLFSRFVLINYFKFFIIVVILHVHCTSSLQVLLTGLCSYGSDF